LLPISSNFTQILALCRFAEDCHVAGLDIFAADLLFTGINKVVVRKGNEKGRRKSIIAVEGGGRVGGPMYIELAKYYMNSGQVEEAKHTLFIARTSDEEDRRVAKALSLVSGEIRVAPSMKRMKGKELEELVEMINE